MGLVPNQLFEVGVMSDKHEKAVKPLAWESYNIDMHKAETFFGYYAVAASGHCWLNAGPLSAPFESICRTVDTAKAFCQADYEMRILSALTAPQTVLSGEAMDDLPQSPWPASDWAIDRIAALEGALARSEAMCANLDKALEKIVQIGKDRTEKSGWRIDDMVDEADFAIASYRKFVRGASLSSGEGAR